MATFADFLATGSGAVEFRLVIEGCPYIFVTSPTMETTMTDTRQVVRGLRRSGISIDELSHMQDSTLDLKLSSLQITETDGPYYDAATRAFSGFAAGSTLAFLSQRAAYGDASAFVRSTSLLTPLRFVHVGTETWQVVSIDSVTSEVVLNRGAWRTTPQTFEIVSPSAGDPDAASVVRITDSPSNYAGRRAWLYGHGTSELALNVDDDDDGYLIWRGTLATNPEESDSRTWSLSMQSRLALFDSNIGKASVGGTALRGVYYSAQAPLYIGFNKLSGASDSGSIVAGTNIFLHGFWETQTAFCVALAAALRANATLRSWGGTWGATPDPDGTWNLYYLPGAAPVWVTVEGGSPVDGVLTGGMVDARARVPLRTATFAILMSATWATSGGFIPLAVPPDQVRHAPRAYYYPLDLGSIATPASDVDIATWPLQRFYLNFSTSIGAWGEIKITAPSLTGGASTEIHATVSAAATGGYVEIPSSSLVLASTAFAAAGTFQPTIELAYIYGPGTGGCDLAQFMASVIARSQDTCNVGGPFLTSDDVADWTAEVSAATGGISALATRVYAFAKPKKLIDVVREECKLYGLVLCLDMNGKIAVRRLPASGSSTPDLTIDSTIHAPSDDFGKNRLSPDGIVSIVNVKGEYSSADDKWNSERPFEALGSVAITKSKGQTVTISPYARPYIVPSEGGDVPAAVAQAIVSRILSLFGAQYYYVELPVTMLAHGKRIGDEVLVTVRQLPFAGARAQNTPGAGMTNVRAFVIGRSWKYGDSPSGTLTLLMAARNTAGYTPSALLVSAAGSSLSWSLTVAQAQYGPQSTDPTALADASFFAATYRVVLWELDAESPRSARGTVSAVAGNVISVTFDSAWDGWGGAQAVLEFDDSTSVALALGEKAYCYLADASWRIVYADGSAVAPRDLV